MCRYKRILAGVSLGKQDGASIRYTGMISRMAESEKIIFLHVASTVDVAEELREEYPDLLKTDNEPAKKETEDIVNRFFEGHPRTTLEYRVVEGAPLIEFLRIAKEEEIDLIVLRKRGTTDGGGLFEKLARKAPCSVLFVPEGTKAWFRDIVVPVDFSENSGDAVETAVNFALSSEKKQIYCLHIYTVPIGYYKTGKTYEEFAEIMKGHAEKNFRNFINGIDLKGVSAVPLFKLEKKEYAGIEKAIEEYPRCLLLLGARGRKAGAGVLLGSVTEQLIKSTSVPLIAVKKKGTGLGILDALLKL